MLLTLSLHIAAEVKGGGGQKDGWAESRNDPETLKKKGWVAGQIQKEDSGCCPNVLQKVIQDEERRFWGSHLANTLFPI